MTRRSASSAWKRVDIDSLSQEEHVECLVSRARRHIHSVSYAPADAVGGNAQLCVPCHPLGHTRADKLSGMCANSCVPSLYDISGLFSSPTSHWHKRLSSLRLFVVVHRKPPPDQIMHAPLNRFMSRTRAPKSLFICIPVVLVSTSLVCSSHALSRHRVTE